MPSCAARASCRRNAVHSAALAARSPGSLRPPKKRGFWQLRPGTRRVLSYLNVWLQCAMPQNTRDSLRTAWILFATAFAAGAVDIIGFAKLGGVFASAMTGNFALLAYHVAKGNTLSAIGSVIALLGFVSGCLIGFTLRRGRSDRTTVSLLLGAEAVLAVGVCRSCRPCACRLRCSPSRWDCRRSLVRSSAFRPSSSRPRSPVSSVASRMPSPLATQQGYGTSGSRWA